MKDVVSHLLISAYSCFIVRYLDQVDGDTCEPSDINLTSEIVSAVEYTRTCVPEVGPAQYLAWSMEYKKLFPPLTPESLSLHPELKRITTEKRSAVFIVFSQTKVFVPPNGPELSCGGEQPPQRNPVRAWYVQSDSNWLFRACKIVDGWFRQLERLVRRRYLHVDKNTFSYYQLRYVRNYFQKWQYLNFGIW